MNSLDEAFLIYKAANDVSKDKRLQDAILDILFDQSRAALQTKQRALKDLLGETLSRDEIKQLMRDNKIPHQKSPYKRQRAKKIYERSTGMPVKTPEAGEGIHAYKNPARRTLTQEGYKTPAGYEVHHLNAVHGHNDPENMALIKPEGHSAFHMMHPDTDEVNSFMSTITGEEPKMREIMYGMKEPKKWKGKENPSESVQSLVNRINATKKLNS